MGAIAFRRYGLGSRPRGALRDAGIRPPHVEGFARVASVSRVTEARRVVLTEVSAR
jgi:hypothetical protein